MNPRHDIAPPAGYRDQLTALGVVPGSHVGLGISLRAVAADQGGARSFMDTLIDHLGPEGTVMLPAFSPKYALTLLQLGRIKDVYDPAASPIRTGKAAAMLHAKAGARRSRHPTNSYVAFGAASELLLARHDHREGAYEPYRRLAEIGGVLLSIGIGDVLPAVRHLSQADAGLLALVPRRYGAKFKDEKGRLRIFRRPDVGGCAERLPLLVAEMRARGDTRDGMVGNARAVAVEARRAIGHMTDALKARPLDYLCASASCLWCREVEARLSPPARGRAPVLPSMWRRLRLREPLVDEALRRLRRR
jgi:aminoglycoside 3-N-acetyltransferase